VAAGGILPAACLERRECLTAACIGGTKIFGYDPTGNEIFAHAYGAGGASAPSTVSCRGNKYVIAGGLLNFKGRFSKNGDALTVIWPTTDGAIPVMELTLKRNERNDAPAPKTVKFALTNSSRLGSAGLPRSLNIVQ